MATNPASSCSSDDDDSIWGEVSDDSGLACVDYDDHEDDSAPSGDDLSRVHEAVVRGATPEELAAILDECARGSDERRKAAANEKGLVREREPADWRRHRRRQSHRRPERFREEVPLQAALRLGRRELLGPLLVAGANPRDVSAGRLTALGVAATHGGAATIRDLLGAGGHDANEKMDNGKTAAHVALSRDGDYSPPTPEQLECITALVQGGADVNAVDGEGNTMLLKLRVSAGRNSEVSAALNVLAGQLGADVEAQRPSDGRTLLFSFLSPSRVSVLRQLLRVHHASADVVDAHGDTPLLLACAHRTVVVNGAGYDSVPNQGLVELVLHASSTETRRAVLPYGGRSAADVLVDAARTMAPAPAWLRQAIAELLSSGAPVLPQNQELAQDLAAPVADGAEAAAPDATAS
jgi:hypothetical protein